MAFIETIEYEQATGDLRKIYDELIGNRGKLADVHKIQSLHPETIVSHINLYKDIMFGHSPLKRYQREMIGVVVSSVNQCEYCTRHHSEALMHYWKNTEKIQSLIRQPDSANLSEVDVLLCQFARDITTTPELATQQKIDLLKVKGLTDRAILDATLIIAYFNFVNRIALGLGLAINEEEITGYNY